MKESGERGDIDLLGLAKAGIGAYKKYQFDKMVTSYYSDWSNAIKEGREEKQQWETGPLSLTGDSQNYTTNLTLSAFATENRENNSITYTNGDGITVQKFNSSLSDMLNIDAFTVSMEDGIMREIEQHIESEILDPFNVGYGNYGDIPGGFDYKIGIGGVDGTYSDQTIYALDDKTREELEKRSNEIEALSEYYQKNIIELRERTLDIIGGSLFKNLYEDNILFLSNPDSLNQSQDGPLTEKLFSLYNDIYDNPDKYQFVPDLNMSQADQEKARQRFEKLKADIMDPEKNNWDLANNTVRATCLIESFWEYAVATKQYNKSFESFYTEEFLKGNIGQAVGIDDTSQNNMNYGIGSDNWRKRFGMESINNTVNEVTMPLTDSYYVNTLNESGKQYSVMYINNSEKEGDRGYGESRGTHFVIAMKGEDGEWYWYDHNNKPGYRKSKVDWGKVYQVDY